jgi:hypothetical protein
MNTNFEKRPPQMDLDRHRFSMGVRAPVCWKVAPGVVWIQVHRADQARDLARIVGGRRVAYSVAGPYLRTFEFARSLHWAENWVRRQLSRETGTNEAFSVLAGPETRRSAGRGSGWPTER